MIDSALRFWLHHVETGGGLWEQSGDSTVVVLPDELSRRYHLDGELLVATDPDVAREDGLTFLGPGHPVLTQAAESVLASGDAGHLLLARPASVPPGKDVLLDQARDRFPADHGKIDLVGEPTPVLRPVLRVGALVSFEVSTQDRFQEQAERWVDVPSRREVGAGVVHRLSRAPASEKDEMATPEGLLLALAEAHRLIDDAATARRTTLAGQLADAHTAERARATMYYDDAITGIERRLASAPEDRRPVLEARLGSTRQEQVRRLVEIAEKYEARHEIRPFRLHVIHVPSLRLPVDVRRGDRRYPIQFDWLLPAAAFAPVRCPSCSGTATLVAGKTRLGCQSCLTPRPAPAAPQQRRRP